MEKFVQKGTEITAPVPTAPPGTTGLGGFEVPSSKGESLRSDASNLNVGVLHLVPTLEVFPLLADLKTYANCIFLFLLVTLINIFYLLVILFPLSSFLLFGQ